MPTVEIQPGLFSICRLEAGAPLPAWARGEFVFLARTPEETSIVCPSGAVPAGVRREPGWRLLKVAGPLDFSQVGVLASLTGPLAAAGVPIFAVSTFDTDYLLVKQDRLAVAAEVLARSGHAVRRPGGEDGPE